MISCKHCSNQMLEFHEYEGYFTNTCKECNFEHVLNINQETGELDGSETEIFWFDNYKVRKLVGWSLSDINEDGTSPTYVDFMSNDPVKSYSFNFINNKTFHDKESAQLLLNNFIKLLNLK